MTLQCVWISPPPSPFFFRSLSTWRQPELFKVETTAFLKQGLCVDAPNYHLISLTLNLPTTTIVAQPFLMFIDRAS
jgi:hypothetical protein